MSELCRICDGDYVECTCNDEACDDIAPGQTLYFIGRGLSRRAPEIKEVTVLKVGRKWITFYWGTGESMERMQASNNTGRAEFSGEVDGGNYSSPGRLYYTLDQVTEILHKDQLISAFHRQHVDFRELTVEDLIQVLTLLGLEVPPPPSVTISEEAT